MYEKVGVFKYYSLMFNSILRYFLMTNILYK